MVSQQLGNPEHIDNDYSQSYAVWVTNAPDHIKNPRGYFFHNGTLQSNSRMEHTFHGMDMNVRIAVLSQENMMDLKFFLCLLHQAEISVNML